MVDTSNILDENNIVNRTDTAFSSAARTASISFTQFPQNYYYRGVQIFWNVTAITASPSVELIVSMTQFSTGGALANILISPPVTSVSINSMIIYPGITIIPGLAASTVLPRDWGIVMVHANANSITYSVFYKLLR